MFFAGIFQGSLEQQQSIFSHIPITQDLGNYLFYYLTFLKYEVLQRGIKINLSIILNKVNDVEFRCHLNVLKNLGSKAFLDFFDEIFKLQKVSVSFKFSKCTQRADI